MRKILIIGTGGIGSFLIPVLDKVGLYNITVADPDIVEKKNIPYQNFSDEDIGERVHVRTRGSGRVRGRSVQSNGGTQCRANVQVQ